MNIPNPNGSCALVSIDPGRNMGFAVFIQRPAVQYPPSPNWVWTLKACGLVSSRAADISAQARETRGETQRAVLAVLWANGFHPGQHPLAVCELMEFRPDDRRSNATDLIRVATIGAAVAGMLSPETTFVTPQEWKGQVPKDIMGARILRQLDPPESAVLARDMVNVPPSLVHNTLDAIGIGLWATGRASRGGG